MRYGSAAIMTLLLVTGRTEAQKLIPLGSEFQVNTYTTKQQYDATVAGNDAGDFVVVWGSLGSAGNDSSDFSVQARLFDSHGIGKGDDFQVNSYTTGRQRWPGVAVDADGNFVVVWGSRYSEGDDSSSHSVQGQRYDAGGAAVGGQFEVNTYTPSGQNFPEVAFNADGDFVVVWTSLGSAETDNSSYSVQARRFNSSGVPLSGDHQINTYWDKQQQTADVISDGSRDFVVAWQSLGSYGNDSSHWSVQGQRYDIDGTFTGGQFQVNSYTTSHQYYPALASDRQGNFVVVWQSNGSYGTDADWSIQAQLYDASATPRGSQLQVNSYTTGAQEKPAVVMDSSGNFVVLWESVGSYGSDTDQTSIQAQLFDTDANPVGTQFQVNSYTTGNQEFPELSATDLNGSFVAVWNSDFGSGSDTWRSVQARRLSLRGVFFDAFESSDLSAWSRVVP